jgi:hypothetical protein
LCEIKWTISKLLINPLSGPCLFTMNMYRIISWCAYILKMCYGFTRIIPCFKFDQRNTTSAPILQKTHIPPKYKTLIIFCDICIYNINIASSNTIYSVLHTLKKKRGSSWSWSYGSWIYNYLCIQCLSPLMLRIWIPLMARSTRGNFTW